MDCWREITADISAGRRDVDVLRDKRSSLLTVRATVSDSESVIVKLWDRQGLKDIVRGWCGVNGAQREWRAMSLLYERGVSVPRPVQCVPVSGDGVAHTDAIIIEDLGRCLRVGDELAGMIESRRFEEVIRIENGLIEITRDMIRAGVLDLDHSATNFVLTPEGRVVRLDLEFARCFGYVGLHTGLYGRMLGRLIGTFTFAVQPDLDRAVLFAQRLAEAVDPPRGVLLRAKKYVDDMLAQQLRECGLDYILDLAW